MFGLFKSSKPKLVHIEGLPSPITVNGKQTILTAALAQGVRFPHSCRVGGCASCKCQLTSGRVKELTESAYILEQKDLENGYILACQSVPKTDVSIRVDTLSSTTQAIKTLSGQVVGQKRLTHDIVALDILMDEAMHYTAGQYAQISVPNEIESPRSYSFAFAPSTTGDAMVQFYVRAVPGGKMSNWAQGDILGREVSVEGPFGDFYLRESERPILCIAGGSGLAPIKALLEDALAYKSTRPVVFLFGARTQQDLYCLDQINRIANQWAGDFTFVPVLSEEPKLSEEPEESDWKGARGLVTDLLDQYASGDTEAYLCGPPPMLDAAEEKLDCIGIPSDRIFSDKFFDQSNTNRQ